MVPKANFRLKVVPADGAQTASCRSLREKNPPSRLFPRHPCIFLFYAGSHFLAKTLFWRKNGRYTYTG